MIKFIGKGSFGAVYRVRRLSDGMEYAMKQINVTQMNASERKKVRISTRPFVYMTDNRVKVGGNGLSESCCEHRRPINVLPSLTLPLGPSSPTVVLALCCGNTCGIQAVNEIRILASLNSPYIVRFYEAFIENDSVCFLLSIPATPRLPRSCSTHDLYVSAVHCHGLRRPGRPADAD